MPDLAHHHRRPQVSPIVLALVLLAATAAALLPLAVVVGAFRWGSTSGITLAIAAVVTFALLFPFAFRYLSRGDR